MTDRERMYGGLSCAAWGYFLLHFSITLGRVNILPAFAGYLMLRSAIIALSEERRDLALLYPLCILLAVWNGIDWLFSWLGGDIGGLLPPLSMVISAAGLYFHFQFLTDMAALAEACQPEGDDLDQRLLRRRTAYTVLTTAASVLAYLPIKDFAAAWDYAVMGLTVVLLAAAVFVMLGLFALRQCFREGEGQEPDA